MKLSYSSFINYSFNYFGGASAWVAVVRKINKIKFVIFFINLHHIHHKYVRNIGKGIEKIQLQLNKKLITQSMYYRAPFNTRGGWKND